MIVECQKCKALYDDAECWTICPHGPLWASVGSYCPRCDLVDCQTHHTGRYADPAAVPGTMLSQLDDLNAKTRRFGLQLAASLHLPQLVAWLTEVLKPKAQRVEESGPAQAKLLATADPQAWAAEFCRITGFKDEDWAFGWFANAIWAGYDAGAERERQKRQMIQLWNRHTGKQLLVTPGDEHTGINQTPRVFLDTGDYEVEFYDRATLDTEGPDPGLPFAGLADQNLVPVEVATGADAGCLRAVDAPARPAHRDRRSAADDQGMA